MHQLAAEQAEQQAEDVAPTARLAIGRAWSESTWSKVGRPWGRLYKVRLNLEARLAAKAGPD